MINLKCGLHYTFLMLICILDLPRLCKEVYDVGAHCLISVSYIQDVLHAFFEKCY